MREFLCGVIANKAGKGVKAAATGLEHELPMLDARYHTLAPKAVNAWTQAHEG